LRGEPLHIVSAAGAAGAAGGGASHTGAVVEVRKVGGALNQFDVIVRKRNAELLGNLQETLKGLSIFDGQILPQ